MLFCFVLFFTNLSLVTFCFRQCWTLWCWKLVAGRPAGHVVIWLTDGFASLAQPSAASLMAFNMKSITTSATLGVKSKSCCCLPVSIFSSQYSRNTQFQRFTFLPERLTLHHHRPLPPSVTLSSSSSVFTVSRVSRDWFDVTD